MSLFQVVELQNRILIDVISKKTYYTACFSMSLQISLNQNISGASMNPGGGRLNLKFLKV